MTGLEPRLLGRFEVRAEPAEVTAFRRATGLPVADALPLTFPIRWLAAPAVRAAMSAMVPDADLVFLHEAQTFDYAVPLRCGETYAMALTARREDDPDRLVVDATILAADGAPCARCETVLRLVRVADAAP